jgi:fucose permease
VAARFLLLIVYLCFISVGLPDAVMGTAWPEVRRTLSLPLESLSVILMAFTLCGAVSGFGSGPVVKLLGTNRLAALSCALTGLALIGYANAPHLAWLAVMAGVLGLGCGAIDFGLNHFVAERYAAKHMNWLHACWGLGAMSGPLILGAAIAQSGWRTGVLWIAAVQMTLATVLLLSLRLWAFAPAKNVHAQEAKAPSDEPGADPAFDPDSQPRIVASNVSPSPWALFCAPMSFFFYVAAESGVGMWLASVLVEQRDFAASRAALWVSVYFGAIMVGRFLVGLIADRFGNRRLVSGGTILAFCGVLLFMVSPAVPISLLALALIGLGLAPVYPSLMHEAARRFSPDWVRRVIGWQAGTAYLGMATCPPLMAGLVSAYGLGAVFPLIAVLLLLLWVSTEVLNALT